MDQDYTKYRQYLWDFAHLMRSQAFEEIAERHKALTEEEKAYHTGRVSAYHRVISLLQQQADGFDIPLEELKLHDIDADKDIA